MWRHDYRILSLWLGILFLLPTSPVHGDAITLQGRVQADGKALPGAMVLLYAGDGPVQPASTRSVRKMVRSPV